jgi:hypothetical protein
MKGNYNSTSGARPASRNSGQSRRLPPIFPRLPAETLAMNLLPNPEVKPARPVSVEPDASLLLLAQIFVARIVLDNPVDHLGIRATLLASLATKSDPAVTDTLAEWAIHKLLETGALRLIYNKPRSKCFWAGLPGDQPPKIIEWVSFAEQVVAPNPDLHKWLPDYNPNYTPPTNESVAEEIRRKREFELIEQGKALARHERNPKPRNTVRDDEIVRLHDVEGKSFGQIGRLLLQANSTWCKAPGKPLSRAAVQQAYHRRKRKTDK